MKPVSLRNGSGKNTKIGYLAAGSGKLNHSCTGNTNRYLNVGIFVSAIRPAN
jgi:hypothetical protein